MKHKKKLSLLLALALGVTPVLTSVNQPKVFAEEQNSKIEFNKNFIETLDNFVKTEKNKFVLNEGESLNKIIKEFSLKNNFREKEVLENIKNRIEIVNKDIKNNAKFITKDKNIVSSYKEWDSFLGHDVEQKWWGFRHTLNNKNQVKDYTYKLSTASNIQAGASLIAGFLNPIAGLIGSLSVLYFNQAATDINHFWEKHERAFYFDVAWTLNYNFEFK